MTSRERWTVYPLLFLALGLAVRAIYLLEKHLAAPPPETLEAGRIECRELLVRDADGAVILHVPPADGD